MKKAKIGVLILNLVLLAVVGSPGLRSEAAPAARTNAVPPAAATTFQSSSPLDQMFTQAIDKALPAVVMVICKDSLGSGYIINAQGAYYIVTNRHVVLDKDPNKSCLVNSNVEVTLTTGDTMPGKVYSIDKDIDMALIVPTHTSMPDGSPLPFIKLGNSAALKPGQWVIAIGHPLGLSNSVSVGVVSALSRGEGKQSYIQTDVAINHGNSGGPLINLASEVIGMNTMGIREVQGEVYEGLNFAIPINLIIARIPPQAGAAPLPPGYLGMKSVELTATQARALKVKPGNLQITDIIPGSPADQAGLQKLDIIASVDGVEVTNKTIFDEDVNSKRMGSEVLLMIDRKGQKLSKKVTLGRSISYVTLEAVGLRCEPGPGGVKVSDKGVKANSEANKAGLASGDLILAAGPDRNNLKPVSTPEGLLRELRAGFTYHDVVVLHVQKPSGEQRELSINLPPEPEQK